MPDFVIRSFRRDDRDQLTRLVNAHIAAVIPGVSVSVNTVLSQMERRPTETIIDPWVVERVTLVAEQAGAVVAAAHLLRYGVGSQVSDSYRDAGVLEWLVAANWDPTGPEDWLRSAAPAADALMAACLAQFQRWRVRSRYFDGKLPAPATYGLPAQWPHLGDLLRRTGWELGAEHSVELILVASTDDLPRPVSADLAVRRSMGELGTRFTAHRGGADLGYLEIDTDLASPERISRLGGWADVCRTEGEPEVVRWLFGQVASWLRLGGIDRLLDYLDPGDESLPLLLDCGFVELTRTERGWEHRG
ncbi:hypothetical protein ABZV58_15835 [Nocardia sp. NPDC004654]|uniref:hypothetical protein n=1 Tax=Nocardia sp. NPDC004654 TaxID=3154776 RepID=UPI0033BB1B46